MTTSHIQIFAPERSQNKKREITRQRPIWRTSNWKCFSPVEGNNEILPDTCSNGPRSEHQENQMLGRMWSSRNSHSLLAGIKDSTAPLKDTLEDSYKTTTFLNICKICHSCSLVLPKDLKIMSTQKICTQTFIAILSIIAQTWKQPRGPAIGKWVNKLWCIQTMEYCSALKGNELSHHKKTWKNPKFIGLMKEANMKNYILHD